ncbi:nucleolar complex protein 4 homolog B [Scaptodrosophila lebanonensis]|uniref:Nucleolar complex protein 4 homolog B n=1 Tax=Drosophila lebanonensis TaxID=7225 RepID=A0A6J2U024_DROLE|nr:nucleolar complex protein 4 homolog B [Scaptodrosophila lebanonensis]
MKRPKLTEQEPDEQKEPAVKRFKVPPELQQKANDFLNAKKLNVKVLNELVELLEKEEGDASGVMHVLEVVFKNLFKRNCMQPELEENGSSPKAATVAKFEELYEKTWVRLLQCLNSGSKEQSGAALRVCMELIAIEARHTKPPLKSWPTRRLESILRTMIESDVTPPVALQHFQQYARCFDVIEESYKLLLTLTPKKFKDTPNAALNYLAIINLLDLGKNMIKTSQRHVEDAQEFDYMSTRKVVNKVWKRVMKAISGIDEKVHRQVLIVLLERIMSHLNDPIMLTDFLMDSLQQFDGPIALLALQGIFTLMQQQNITYPDVYEKLYSMFYPRMFFNKYKARLFYLADIFLTSTHLPENLVAAFVKRLARLALQSPTKDALIMIHFICNLLLRHTGLQRLIRATPAASAVEITDPYDATETDPVKSKAINSSLWEIMLLQKHAIPEIANAARFINSSLPTQEVELGPLLDMKECDIFDAEVKKQVKQFALAYERPNSLALPQNDMVTKYWSIC